MPGLSDLLKSTDTGLCSFLVLLDLSTTFHMCKIAQNKKTKDKKKVFLISLV